MNRDAENTETGTIQNTNSSEEGYVIYVDSAILDGSENRVIWNDTALTMQVANKTIGNILRGMSCESESATVNELGYLEHQGGLSWNSDSGILFLEL